MIHRPGTITMPRSAGVGRIEIRVPVSPSPEFALMLLVLHRSIRYRSAVPDLTLKAIIGAEIGQQTAAHAFAGWISRYMAVDLVDSAEFDHQGIHATANRRLTLGVDSDVAAVILMDADMIVCNSLAPALDLDPEKPEIGGVIAHVPPKMTVADWGELFRVLDIPSPAMDCRYTGWPSMFPPGLQTDESAAIAPPYFNYGFIVLSRSAIESVRRCLLHSGDHYREALERLYPGSAMFHSQIRLTLAITEIGIPYQTLGMRYNFPNDARLEALHPLELADARVIHLLRRSDAYDKQLIYRDFQSLQNFVAKALQDTGAVNVAARSVAPLLGEIRAELDRHPLPLELAPAHWQW